MHRNRRGFYIYGPDFFFLPNKYWEISADAEEYVAATIRGTGQTVRLPKHYLSPTLREPADSAHSLLPRPRHFALQLPPERLNTFPDGVVDYVRESDRIHDSDIPAKANWTGPKDRWYAFVWEATREPFGSIVIPEKFRPHQRGVAAHYIEQNEHSKNQVVVPVSFYTRDSGDPAYNQLVVAWLNSTIALAFRFEVRSWLGAASERMSGAQLDEKLAVPRRESLSKADFAMANKLLKSCPQELPDYAGQIGAAYAGSWRERLDRFCLELCAIPPTKAESVLNGCIEVLIGWIRSSMGDPSWLPR